MVAAISRGPLGVDLPLFLSPIYTVHINKRTGHVTKQVSMSSCLTAVVTGQSNLTPV